MSDETTSSEDEEPKESWWYVGKGKPPVRSRFQPGQSGNPKGRPKKDRSQKAILERVLAEEVVAIVHGKKRRITAYEAMVRAHLAKALKGDRFSLKIILEEVAAAGLYGSGAQGGVMQVPFKMTDEEFEAIIEVQQRPYRGNTAPAEPKSGEGEKKPDGGGDLSDDEGSNDGA